MSAGSVIPAVMEKTFMELMLVTYRRIRLWARDGSVGSSAATRLGVRLRPGGASCGSRGGIDRVFRGHQNPPGLSTLRCPARL